MCYAAAVGGRLRTLGIVTAALFMASPALAADCPTPYTLDNVLEDLTAIETAVRESDDAATAEAGKKMGAGLACLDEVLPALISARTYRAVGAGFLAGGDEASADKWLRTALEIDPTWEYGLQDVPEGHPLRPHFEELRREPATDPVAVENKVFGEGEYYLNGRKISRPQARTDRYHVFQAKTAVLATEVIEGNAFPESALVASEPVADASGKPKKDKKPKEKSAKAPKDKSKKGPKEEKQKVAKAPKTRTKTVKNPDGTTKVITIRKRPPEKIPLLIGGGAIIAGSGLLYYSAGQKAKVFDPDHPSAIKSVLSGTHMADINGVLGEPDGSMVICEDGRTPEVDGCYVSPRDEAERVRKSVNQLVAASASLLVVGVGVTTWGVLVDGDRVMPTVNLRF